MYSDVINEVKKVMLKYIRNDGCLDREKIGCNRILCTSCPAYFQNLENPCLFSFLAAVAIDTDDKAAKVKENMREIYETHTEIMFVDSLFLPKRLYRLMNRKIMIMEIVSIIPFKNMG